MRKGKGPLGVPGVPGVEAVKAERKILRLEGRCREA